MLNYVIYSHFTLYSFLSFAHSFSPSDFVINFNRRLNKETLNENYPQSLDYFIRVYFQ